MSATTDCTLGADLRDSGEEEESDGGQPTGDEDSGELTLAGDEEEEAMERRAREAERNQVRVEFQ